MSGMFVWDDVVVVDDLLRFAAGGAWSVIYDFEGPGEERRLVLRTDDEEIVSTVCAAVSDEGFTVVSKAHYAGRDPRDRFCVFALRSTA